jgi:hypothetical protein
MYCIKDVPQHVFDYSYAYHLKTEALAKFDIPIIIDVADCTSFQEECDNEEDFDNPPDWVVSCFLPSYNTRRL